MGINTAPPPSYIIGWVFSSLYYYIYDGVHRVSGLRREPVCSVREAPHTDPNIPLKKDNPDPVVADSDPLVASPVRVFCARNSQREGWSLPRQGRDHLFQWDVGISAGLCTETTGSLRNLETRRNPSLTTTRGPTYLPTPQLPTRNQ